MAVRNTDWLGPKRLNRNMQDERDHIFVSYATEQSALSDWLARKLAVEGYAVWYDRLKLLGGENWPNDIDAAIEKRTFRMLALLSKASMNKDNPQGEWLKGRAIGKELGIDDFVIPLNVEGLKPHEITWNFQPVNYIPFSPSWKDGLTSVLSKLESIKAPRVLLYGPHLAIESTSTSPVVREQPEQLISNCFEILQIPRYIYTFVSSSRVASDNHRVWRQQWAYRDVSPYRVLAFDSPPPSIAVGQRFQCVRQDAWSDVNEVNGIKSRDLMVSLVHRCLDVLLASSGLAYSARSRRWYLPSGVLHGDRVPITYPDGMKRWFKGVGDRKYPTTDGGEMYRYHLSPSFRMLRNRDAPYVLVVEHHLYLTNLMGVELEGRKVQSRRKHVGRNWFNREWGARTLGVLQLLAGEDMRIRIGPEGEQQLVINALPISPTASRSIHDELAGEPDEIYTTWHDDEPVLNDPETDE